MVHRAVRHNQAQSESRTEEHTLRFAKELVERIGLGFEDSG